MQANGADGPGCCISQQGYKLPRLSVWPAVSQSLRRKRWLLTCPTWFVSG